MTFQAEIFQGMFSTIIIARPCKFDVNLFSYQFCNVSLNAIVWGKRMGSGYGSYQMKDLDYIELCGWGLCVSFEFELHSKILRS